MTKTAAVLLALFLVVLAFLAIKVPGFPLIPQQKPGTSQVAPTPKPEAQQQPTGVPEEISVTGSREANKPLVLYLDGNLLPQAWLDEWKQAHPNIAINQRELKNTEVLPNDGDMYSITPPEYLNNCSTIHFLELEQGDLLKITSPAFTGQAFDLDNKYTRPWRWTPWFFYVRLSPAAKGPMPDIKTLWENPKAIYPNALRDIVALKIKERKETVAMNWNAEALEMRSQVESGLKNRMASAQDCWQALKDGNAEASFLPAVYRLQPPITDPAGLRWEAPPHGTIIHLELLAIRADSANVDNAKVLMAFLLDHNQQQRMVTSTGYFPTCTLRGKETEGCPIPLPKGEWFDLGEFSPARFPDNK
jgi:hypothetical protein